MKRERNRITAVAGVKTWFRRRQVSSIHPGASGGYGGQVPRLSRIGMGLGLSFLCLIGSAAGKSKIAPGRIGALRIGVSARGPWELSPGFSLGYKL